MALKNIYYPPNKSGRDICVCGHKRHDHQLKTGMCYVHKRYSGCNFRCVCDKFKLAKSYNDLKGGRIN